MTVASKLGVAARVRARGLELQWWPAMKLQLASQELDQGVEAAATMGVAKRTMPKVWIRIRKVQDNVRKHHRSQAASFQCVAPQGPQLSVLAHCGGNAQQQHCLLQKVPPCMQWHARPSAIGSGGSANPLPKGSTQATLVEAPDYHDSIAILAAAPQLVVGVPAGLPLTAVVPW